MPLRFPTGNLGEMETCGRTSGKEGVILQIIRVSPWTEKPQVTSATTCSKFSSQLVLVPVCLNTIDILTHIISLSDFLSNQYLFSRINFVALSLKAFSPSVSIKQPFPGIFYLWIFFSISTQFIPVLLLFLFLFFLLPNSFLFRFQFLYVQIMLQLWFVYFSACTFCT